MIIDRHRFRSFYIQTAIGVLQHYNIIKHRAENILKMLSEYHYHINILA